MEGGIWAAEAREWETVHLDRLRDVEFWTAEFALEQEELVALIEEVGPAVDDIVSALRRE